WTKAVGHPGSLPGSVRWTDHGGSGWAVFGLDEHGPWKSMIHDAVIWSAAADHCLAAAYRGECPGVDPDELMHWRVAVRAAHQGRPVAELLEDVEQACERLRAAPVVALGERLAARDLRGKHVPELPEAAVREGMVYLATVADRDGREKVVLGGHADAEMVRAFLESW